MKLIETTVDSLMSEDGGYTPMTMFKEGRYFTLYTLRDCVEFTYYIKSEHL